MSLGPIMLDIAGTELTDEDRELLQHPAVGGVILFARNYQHPEQLAALTAAIRGLREPHLLIAVDQEGGRVQRFRDGFQRLPSASEFGEFYQQSPQEARRASKLVAWLMASELQAVGVDYSFAPVLDVDQGLCRAIIGRAFSSDAQVVSELATAWLQGSRLAGMAAVGKHFPGHGGVEADSHLSVPYDQRDFATLWQDDLLPFRHLVNQGIEAVMPSHVVFPEIDSQPTGFSACWLQDILRDKMGFQGVIISDALDMAAAEAAGSFVERSQAALKAGCDQLLVCNNRDAALEVVDALKDYHHPLIEARLARLYSRHFIPHTTLQQHPYWSAARQVLEKLEQCERANDPQDLSYDPTTRGGKVI